ncbi:Chorismate synthase [Diplonema papillatum]|nr:Chorismate synthase [Diplonema papillatum]KAJ9460447.1 Chorismate synthase [Diplonema papillatum]|eukprot:gene15917-24340_t
MSTFGRAFRVTTFGESHCPGVGVIIDGFPGKIPLTEELIQPQLTRRRPGQSAMSTPRNEADAVSLLSGVEFGKSLGTPIGAMVRNKDQRPQDYGFQQEKEFVPRPSHADYTYRVKYGTHSSSGGGRSSARETIGRVIAGGVAEAFFAHALPDLQVVAWVSKVGHLAFNMPPEQMKTITREEVDAAGMTRCPEKETAEKIEKYVAEVRAENDSVGGCVSCVVRNVPVGLGEPCFDKLEAMLAHAMLSIPATKGFEIGSGFAGAEQRGSQHNDMYCKPKADAAGITGAKNIPRLGTETNRSGGTQGGISNGEDVYFTVAFKPPATISQAQSTCDLQGESTVLEAKGRHDPCVVNRAVPIVEAMASIVIMDAIMLQKAREF